ncbi:MAG TPA: ester cyclase [Streptosporangiaceae bacterium]|nr:ester cyclase [Streptosporangiaceae bacterium]
MAMTSGRDVYEQAIGSYNAGDLDGLAEAYTEDAVLVSPDGTAQGQAAIREHWSQEKAAFPDRAMTIDVIVEQGDTIAAEWTWAGTHTGPLVLPDGTELPPTGKRVEGKGMDLAQLRGGKAAVLHQYWDNMALARQLGLVP